MDDPNHNTCRACPKCGIILKRGNFARHWRIHHSETATPTFAIPVTVMSQQQPIAPGPTVRPYGESDTVSVAASSAAVSDTSTDSLPTQYAKAARALLKQHHRPARAYPWDKRQYADHGTVPHAVADRRSRS